MSFSDCGQQMLDGSLGTKLVFSFCIGLPTVFELVFVFITFELQQTFSYLGITSVVGRKFESYASKLGWVLKCLFFQQMRIYHQIWKFITKDLKFSLVLCVKVAAIMLKIHYLRSGFLEYQEQDQYLIILFFRSKKRKRRYWEILNFANLLVSAYQYKQLSVEVVLK